LVNPPTRERRKIPPYGPLFTEKYRAPGFRLSVTTKAEGKSPESHQRSSMEWGLRNGKNRFTSRKTLKGREKG